MSNKPVDGEYYKRQSNIYSLLFQAYLDKYFLDSVDYFKANLPKERTAEINNTVFVIAHICELAKKDMALTLWKVFYDDSPDANTVKALNRYLYAKYNIKHKLVETERIKKIRALIIAARHGFIAHNLLDDRGRALQISDLVNALQDIRTLFNDVSLRTIDDRAHPLTDAQIYSISFYEKVGFDLMFQGILQTPENCKEVP